MFEEDRDTAQDSNIDERINKLRERLGVTQADLAAKDGRGVDPMEAKVKEGEDFFSGLEAMTKDVAATAGGDKEKASSNVVQMAGGLLEMGQELGNFALDIGNAAEKFMKDNGIADIDIVSNEEFSFADRLIPETDDTTGRIARTLTQYVTPFTSLSLISKGTRAVRMAKGVVGAAAVSAAAIDPHEERLANMIQEVPELANPVAEYLAADPNDTNMEGRLKSAIESILVDIPLAGLGELVFQGVKHAKKSRIFQKTKDRLSGNAVEEPVETTITKIQGEEPISGEPGQIDVGPEGAGGVQPTPGTQPAGEARVVREGPSEKVPNIEPPEDDEFVRKFREAETPEEMSKVLRESGRTEEDLLIESARRGVVSDEQVRENAARILKDRERVDKLLAREHGEALNAEEVGALRAIYERDTLEMMNALPPKGAERTVEDRIRFKELYNRWTGRKANLAGAKAELGRGLRASRLAYEASDADAARIVMLERQQLEGGAQSIDEIMDAFDQIRNTPDADLYTARKRLQKTPWNKASDALFEVWINGVLSGVKTHVVNITSNALVLADNLVVATFSRGMSKLRKNDFTPEGEIEASLIGLVSGLQDGWSAIKHMAKTGEAPKGRVKYKEMHGPRAISADNWSMDPSSRGGQTVDVVGKIINLPGTALKYEDAFFRVVNYRQRVHQLAVREAAQSGLEHGSKEWDNFIKETIENPPAYIDNAANKQATENIFAQDWNPDMVFGRFGKKSEEIMKMVPLGRYVSPFMRIAGSLVDFSIQRSPGFSYLSPKFRQAMEAGGAQKQEALARVAMGSTLILSSGGLAFSGLVTGSGPKDYKTRKALENGRDGWRPNSIKVPGYGYVEYDRVDPYGALMGMGADIAELIGQVDPAKPHQADELVLAAASLIADNYTPEFVRENMADFYGFVQEVAAGKANTGRFSQEMARMSTGLIPFSSFLRSIRQEVDPVRHDTRPSPDGGMVTQAWEAILNEWKSTIPIPGWRDDLPPQINIFGEAVAYPPGVGPDLVSPFYANTDLKLFGKNDYSPDPVRAELQRLGVHGPLFNPKAPPGESYLKIQMPLRSIRVTEHGLVETIDLDPHQYHKYVQLSAGIGLPGPTLHETLGRVLKQEISDEAKRRAVKEVISQYRARATKFMKTQDPGIAQKMLEFKRNRGESLIGRGSR